MHLKLIEIKKIAEIKQKLMISSKCFFCRLLLFSKISSLIIGYHERQILLAVQPPPDSIVVFLLFKVIVSATKSNIRATYFFVHFSRGWRILFLDYFYYHV